jgi:hypothetical protein
LLAFDDDSDVWPRRSAGGVNYHDVDDSEGGSVLGGAADD